MKALTLALTLALSGCATFNPSVDSSSSQFGLCSIAYGLIWSDDSKRAAVEEMRRRGTWESCMASQAAGASMAASMAANQPASTYRPVPVPALPTSPPPAVIQPVQPLTVQAFWTGRSQMGQSVTGVAGMNCEYQYAGQKFWRMYQGSCPSSIDVR